jgi:cell division protein FtsA
MLKQRSNLITVLDIGSSKVVCIIAKFIPGKKTEILGIGHQASYGIKSGIVSDIDIAQKSIKSAIEEAERIANTKACKAYVAVSSHSLLSQQVITETSIVGKDTTYKDLNKLLLNAVQTFKNQQLEIIHTFACDYILDGHKGITNPVGMYGNHLACRFHVLSAPANSLLNLHSCIAKAGVEIENYVSAVYATGLACLTSDEINSGVTLIDFGAGTTSFAVFEHGQLIYTDSIPIGSIHVTNDIIKVLCISTVEAERIKNLYGGVIPTDIDISEIIEIEQSVDKDDSNQINRAQLINIIQARIEEIIQIVRDKIIHETSVSGIHKIVITGGAARTLRLKELIAHRFNTKVRIGYPKTIPTTSNQNVVLEFTTAVGILIHVCENIESIKNNTTQQNRGNTMKGLISWIKKHFLE